MTVLENSHKEHLPRIWITGATQLIDNFFKTGHAQSRRVSFQLGIKEGVMIVGPQVEVYEQELEGLLKVPQNWGTTTYKYASKLIVGVGQDVI